MDKKEFRAVIKHYFLKGKTATQIQAELQEVHGTSTPSLPTISFWVNEFKRGRTNTDDEPRSGRPKTATNEEMVNKVLDIVMSDRRLKLREIVGMVGISEERVFHILHEILGMRKLMSRWVPRLLTVENKRVRMTIAKLIELQYELLPHPPYSPDLAPCDFFLFPNLKIWLGGKKFASNEEVIAAMNVYFAEFQPSYFLDGLKKLEHRWTKCIELKGDYIEK